MLRQTHVTRLSVTYIIHRASNCWYVTCCCIAGNWSMQTHQTALTETQPSVFTPSNSSNSSNREHQLISHPVEQAHRTSTIFVQQNRIKAWWLTELQISSLLINRYPSQRLFCLPSLASTRTPKATENTNKQAVPSNRRGSKGELSLLQGRAQTLPKSALISVPETWVTLGVLLRQSLL